MPEKAGAFRYRIKNDKLYLASFFVGSGDETEQIFSKPVPTVKEAKAYVAKKYPDLKDYILVKSDSFFGYEAYVELDEAKARNPERYSEKDLRAFEIRRKSSCSMMYHLS